MKRYSYVSLKNTSHEMVEIFLTTFIFRLKCFWEKSLFQQISFRFGIGCAYQCSCSSKNSHGCDPVTGECQCSQVGWDQYSDGHDHDGHGHDLNGNGHGLDGYGHDHDGHGHDHNSRGHDDDGDGHENDDDHDGGGYDHDGDGHENDGDGQW